jgi:hypothetical protein
MSLSRRAKIEFGKIAVHLASAPMVTGADNAALEDG